MAQSNGCCSCPHLTLLTLSWLFSLLLISFSAPALAQGNEKEQLIQTCFKDDCLQRRTSWAHLLEEVPPCLKAARTWLSLEEPRLPVTLVTQLSADRLPQLLAQCHTWMGPLAAAVYLPLLDERPFNQIIKGSQLPDAERQKVQAAMSTINEAVQKSRKEQGCQLNIILFYEIFAHRRAVSLYPVNTLRNYARLLASTPLIANIDVDMLPSLSLSEDLLKTGRSAKYMEACQRNRTLFVLPAFETLCGGPSYADNVAMMSKAQLTAPIGQGCLAQFRLKAAPYCHNATNFPLWHSLPPSAEPYTIQHTELFEPWFMSSRLQSDSGFLRVYKGVGHINLTIWLRPDLSRWFDVSYRGYGKNKIVQVAHMASRGFRFMVNTAGFLVHRAHGETQARIDFLHVKYKSKQDAKLLDNSLYQYIEALWAKHQAEMRNGTYLARVDLALQQCLQTLPWWSSHRHASGRLTRSQLQH